MQLNITWNGAVWLVNAISVYLNIAVGKIRMQSALFKNYISDPNACKLQVLLIAVLNLLLPVISEDKERHFLESQRDSWKNGVEK